MTDSENDGVECLGNPSRPPKRAEFRAPVRASSNKSMNKRNGDSVECLKVAAQLEPSESIIPEPEAFNLDDFAEGARPVRPGKLSKQHQDGPAKKQKTESAKDAAKQANKGQNTATRQPPQAQLTLEDAKQPASSSRPEQGAVDSEHKGKHNMATAAKSRALKPALENEKEADVKEHKTEAERAKTDERPTGLSRLKPFCASESESSSKGVDAKKETAKVEERGKAEAKAKTKAKGRPKSAGSTKNRPAKRPAGDNESTQGHEDDVSTRSEQDAEDDLPETPKESQTKEKVSSRSHVQIPLNFMFYIFWFSAMVPFRWSSLIRFIANCSLAEAATARRGRRQRRQRVQRRKRMTCNGSVRWGPLAFHELSD